MRVWLTRAAVYTLGFIVPWGLVYQLFGTIFAGRSDPANPVAWIASVAAFLVVSGVWAATSRNGQPYAYRIAGLQLVGGDGAPLGRARAFVQSASHAIDFATCGIGFLWALIDHREQTFGDKVSKAYVRVCDRTAARDSQVRDAAERSG
mgnify:CR=1 FL=1